MNLVYLGGSEVGDREEQQDAGFFLDSAHWAGGLVVLCDGAGGHRRGRQAALAAVEAVTSLFRELKVQPESPKEWLQTVCLDAHQAVVALGETPKLTPRATIAILLLTPGCAWWLNVGDTRIYHLREGKIIFRTKDHSMAQILVDQGEIGEEEMGTHPDQSRLLRALGTEEVPKATLGEAKCLSSDGFLVCSDGFWERISRGEIETFFQEPVSQIGLDTMIQTAVERNGVKGDNVTAFAVSQKPDTPNQSTAEIKPFWRRFFGKALSRFE